MQGPGGAQGKEEQKMELLNERNQVRSVARRWQAMYGAVISRGNERLSIVLNKLAALDVEIATAADVAGIVGNGSWVSKKICHECRAETWDSVEVGQGPGYSSEKATICGDCLRAAVRLLDAG